MVQERRKNKPDEDDDYVHIQQLNSQWPKLFDTYFLSPKTRLSQTTTNTTSDDDLVFYVTRQMDNDFHHPLHLVEVFRHHDTKRLPKLAAPEYDWEETTNLNLVLHQFEYTVTTAVCTKTSNKHLQILKRLSTKVYASPSRRDMESKGTEEKITYPNIYFTVDNFEDTFCEMIVNEGQMVCVELVAKNPLLNEQRVLFLGSIKYESLKKVYETRATTSTRVVQRMSLGIYTRRRVEFVRMRGPNGKGHAEMAVSRCRPIQSGITTPESIPTTPMSSSFDEESWNQRRTLDNISTSRWIPPTTRQQQIISNVTTPEVESTDIRQELSDDTGGFLGRTLSQAMNWMRGSNSRLNQPIQTLPLQTCLTYLTLPCQFIVKDILESNQMPILTF
ncbi:unnamed protein product [Rotaria sordida]|uniref:Uncharacterized protein n=1 Tax=Rotaria sordida TaxID=392033 RepID=A0A818LHB8_9BILA|nr:unnamed protein product [Rotaria sordida]CAF3526541.1 unnamed protein product [Rotaria sordida]CAF3577701.1 unnamed protein product [Rotaria sordida]CAF3623086.1 unnamed protein product [Rotaria sordida]